MWNFFMIISIISFWIKKVTILQFSKNIRHLFANIALVTSIRTKKHPYLQQHIASIDLIDLYSNNRSTHCLPYGNTS